MRPPYLAADERRSETVRTVLDMAGQMNPADITTAGIAGRMGLTQAAVFRHFPSKDAIFTTVADWVSTTLLGLLQSAAAEEATPTARITRIFNTHIGFIAAHPGVPRMMFGELQRPGDTLAKAMIRKLLSDYEALVTRQLIEGQASGEVDRSLEPGAAARAFIGMIQGIAVQSFVAGRGHDLNSGAATALSIWQAGISPSCAHPDHIKPQTPEELP